MNLVIDIGNTNSKAAVFQDSILQSVYRFDYLSELIDYFTTFNGEIIVSNVSKKGPVKALLNQFPNAYFLSIETALPITIDYETPKTLGLDRIAAAVGAYDFYKEACFVVDIGTCITLDCITEEGVYLGGSISPGPELRFKSMNNFTATLPFEKLNKESRILAKSTKEALQSGVKYGIIHEILGMYADLQKQFPKIQLVLTGGYTSFFDSMLKEGIFAEPNLVLIGLNTILNYNVKK